MITRSMGRSHQATLEAYVSEIDTEPITYAEAAKDAGWIAAMEEEIQSLKDQGTWTLIPRDQVPSGSRIMGNKWAFKIKRDSSGVAIRKKARLVIKGFMQRKGLEFTEVFAPVITHPSIRLLMIMGITNDLVTFQLDVKSAFLYGQVDQDIYMEQPEGYSGTSNMVCKLEKALYGLKQGARMWHLDITATLKSVGFVNLVNDNGIFMHADRGLILGIWVDDIIGLARSRADHAWLVEKLKSKYTLTEMNEVKFVLGLDISRNKNSIRISQEGYVSGKIATFGQGESRPVHTPAVMGQEDEAGGSKEAGEVPYRELIGGLMYAMVCTRPDIAHSVSALSRHLDAPKAQHWEAGKRVLKYLNTTADYGIEYVRDPSWTLTMYVDSNDGSAKSYSGATFGFVILLAGGPISWKSRKLKQATLSSAESEFMALTDAVQELLWIRDLLEELGIKHSGPTTVYEDNQACIQVAKNLGNTGRMKHLGRRVQFVRDAITNGQIALEYCPTEKMIADIFTKPLVRSTFEKHRDGMGIKSRSGGVLNGERS